MQKRSFLTLGKILSSRWLMAESYAHAYFPSVMGMIQGLQVEQIGDISYLPTFARQGSNIYYISEYGEAAPVSAAPKNSIAVIALRGPITKEDQFCGNAGTETKARQLQEAIDNPNITGIILDIDSGGGDGNATEFFANIINQSSKPVVAYVNGMAASAAYWIASAAKHIVINGNTSEVGSIGVYIQFADFTRFYAERGIDIHTVYAPQSTSKNKAFNDALKGKYDALKQDLSQFADFFINQVQEFRGSKLGADANIFKGSMYYAQDALAQGLVDEIGDFYAALAAVERLSIGSTAGTDLSFNTLNNSEMKINVNTTQTALVAMLALSFAADQTEQEVELNHEQVTALVNAFENATTQAAAAEQRATLAETNLQTANSNVEALTAERDAAIADAADWKQKAEANPGPTNVAATQDAGNAGAKKGIDAYSEEGAEYIELAKEMFKN